MNTSRIPGFYKMNIQERRDILNEMYAFSEDELAALSSDGSLSTETADKMIENVISTFPLPLGLGLNFLINGKEYTVPMAVEEPSIVASASHIAKIVRSAGGFETAATERLMIGQIQVVGCDDFQQAKEALLNEKEALLEAAN